jgi:hypothetical protein
MRPLPLCRVQRGVQELYDLNEDPYQLRNVYHKAGPTLRKELVARLEALRGCAREACWAADVQAVP